MTKEYDITPTYLARKLFPAGEWALTEPSSSRAVVGVGQQILWADEEPLLVVADTGSGKSTIQQNILRASIGLIPSVLGMPARHFKSALYIAADRPKQIRYSLKRMVSEDTADTWDQFVYIHDGPLPFPINEKPESLLPFVKELSEKLDRPPFEAVVIDSLKDIVSEMDDNTPGIMINQALQSLCQNRIQLSCCVHPRKMGSGKDKERNPTLDDVGGNKNIVNGAGSVFYIGAPDDLGYQLLTHLKMPAEKIEGLSMLIDKPSGNISVLDS